MLITQGHKGQFKLRTFVKANSKLISSLEYESKLFLWPSDEGTSSMVKLSHFMISQNYNGIFNFGSTGQFALLIALEESLFLLKIMNTKLSKLVGFPMDSTSSEFQSSQIKDRVCSAVSYMSVLKV